MPATFAPIPDDIVAGLRSGDEKALQRLFRDHYDALIDEAKIVLDDPSFAPRAVEAGVLRAWGHRQEFNTPRDVEEFLRKSVHEAAVRDKSRRAGLHRLEEHEKVQRAARTAAMPTADEVWARIQGSLHAPAVDATASAAAKRNMSRHAAAEHMAQVAKKTSPLVTLGYGALLAAVVAGILFALFRDTPEKKTGRALASANSSEIMSKYGQIGSTTLDDGSKVTIGADSKIRIPPTFNREVRAVAINGTAAFEVAPGELPFEVRIGNAAFIATGTKFAVSQDTGTKTVLGRVTEGTVNVRVGEVVTPLATGKAIAIDESGATREPSAGEVDEALAWLDGRFVIHDRPLRQALEQTRRWYGLALVPADMSLMDRKVSVDAQLEGSKEMIADLEQSGNLKFGWDDKTMMLYDASGTAPKKK